MDNLLNIISTTPLFNGLPEDQIVAIKKIAGKKQYSKGEIIFSEGWDKKKKVHASRPSQG